MNIDEYGQKIEIYWRFAECVRKILLSAIPSDEYHYHLQEIQYRAKEVDSLKKRLEEKKLLDTDCVELHRKDLAGCRIIFYYNDDVNAFIRSNILRDNFKIDWEQLKVHGPTSPPQVANDYYTANHYIVELNDTRSNLPEYCQFKGLKCEIQIQTVLNHAWAETAHDIIYKKPDDSDYGKQVLSSINNQLMKVMDQYLKPAGIEFQKIQRDYKHLLEGRKLLGRDLSKEIISCNNNNERYDLLRRYYEYTLPHFSNYQCELPSIIEWIKVAISESHKIDSINIDTMLGTITSTDILTICLSIVDYVRYVDVGPIFDCLVKLYLSSISEQEKELIDKAVVKLVKYNLDLLKQYGFVVQQIVLDKLENLDFNSSPICKELMANIGSHILTSMFDAHSFSWDTVTFTEGSLPGSEIIESIRKRMLHLLFEQYRSNDPENLKLKMMSALNVASALPIRGTDDELQKIILSNRIDIIEFYIDFISKEQYEILEAIESHIYFLYRQSLGISNNNLFSDESKKLSQIFMEKAINFRDQLNINNDFVIYKILVGFRSVFERSWRANSEWDVVSKHQYRESQIQSYIDGISDKNKEYWEKIVIRCAKTKSNDMATFQLYYNFLNRLAIEKPDFCCELIKNHEQILKPFLSLIFNGLLQSQLRNDFINQMNIWVNDGKYLLESATAFQDYTQLDESMVVNIFEAASAKEDTAVLIKLITVAVKHYAFNNQLIQSLFLACIEKLTLLENANWINDCWFRPEIKKMFSVLSLNESKSVLSSLILLEKIDFHAEGILVPIAEKYPQEVLHFFKHRFDYQCDLKLKMGAYEAIPFNFHEQLINIFAKCLNTMMATIVTWYDDDYLAFCWSGGRLIFNVFPSYSDELNNQLLGLITGNEKSYRVVMAILRHYNGAPAIYEVCRRMISNLLEESELLSEISTILYPGYVVCGEFGRMHALQQQKDAISEWLGDSSKIVNKFATQYLKDLENSIKSEQRQREEDIAMRKLQYGDDEKNN